VCRKQEASISRSALLEAMSNSQERTAMVNFFTGTPNPDIINPFFVSPGVTALPPGVLPGLGVDSISGFGGNDILNGGGGDDFLFGGTGNDAVYGEDGIDNIDGGDGNDVVSGGAGVDVITGGLGADVFSLSEIVSGEVKDYHWWEGDSFLFL
jgi:hypothetical protein